MMPPDDLDRIRNARILVVDDSVASQTLARDLLLHAGCRVDLAQNGQEAISAIEGASEPYDAVLMDLQMPIMDGLETTSFIRRQLAMPDLPIIATTANADRTGQDRCLDAGANECLPKPFHIHDLYAVLVRWVNRGAEGSPEVNDKKKKEGGSGDAPDVTEIWLPDEIPGLDIEGALARMGQKRDLYLGQLIGFACVNAAFGRDMEVAAARGDLDRIKFLAYGIGLTAGVIGADDLSNAAAAIEKAITDGDAALSECLGVFLTQLESLLSAIRDSGLTIPPAIPRRKSGFDRGEAERLIESLLTLLDEQDLDAQREFDKLVCMLGGRGHDAILKELGHNLEALEYSDARRILTRIEKEFLT